MKTLFIIWIVAFLVTASPYIATLVTAIAWAVYVTFTAVGEAGRNIFRDY